MEATKFLSSTLPLHRPQVFSSLSTCRKTPGKIPLMISMAASRSSRSSKRYGGDHHYGGRLVDENMIVLRMRIGEIKMLEKRNEPPSNSMEWEKKYYANNGHDEDVLEAVGFLQNNLMNMRPDLALGLHLWVQRFGFEVSSLWKKVICAIYGLDKNLFKWSWQGGNKSSHFVKAIAELFITGSNSQKLLTEGMQMVMGRGNRARFWTDISHGGIPVRVLFPRILAVAISLVLFRISEVGIRGFRLGRGWWEVSYCPNKSMYEWMDNWIGLCPVVRCVRAWCTLFYAVSWTIWEFRNNLIFKGIDANVAMAVDIVKHRVVLWFKCHGSGVMDPVSVMQLNVKESCDSYLPS
ncbi:hypothetical protein Ddye_012235 [Dipteronia dyeriana]|uniref:Uncharacterized protein n=1 Tax=Dipteronia dyeriana TaxID=168575 RepID=A0AAD9X432_9ROSI|nr:hypothetical protein Ddye_012235 [Dipteronia dyeriana]